MTKEKAIEAAIKDSKRHAVEIAIVHDPISVRSHNEHEEGEYCYCPTNAVDILYPTGTVVGKVDGPAYEDFGTRL